MGFIYGRIIMYNPVNGLRNLFKSRLNSNVAFPCKDLWKTVRLRPDLEFFSNQNMYLKFLEIIKAF